MRLFAAALLSLVLMAGAMAGLTFPPLSGRVVDAAHVLNAPTLAKIDAQLQALETKSSIQLEVATVPSLQGQDIATFANELFRFWKLGQKTTNNGVLLLLAPSEHQVRIEVGYGLEGTLTDVLSNVIITHAMVPRFKNGDISGGVSSGVDDIIAVLSGDKTGWVARQPLRPDNQSSPIGLALFFLMMLVFMFLNWRGQAAGGRRGSMGSAMAGGMLGGMMSGGFGSGGFSSGGGFGGFSGGGGSSGGGGASGGW